MAREIKRLSIKDYDDILRIWSDAGLPYKPLGRDSRERMTREMEFPGAAFFGLFDNGRMIGLGIANYDGRRGWINRVALDPDRRGLGLAGEIISACEDFLLGAGALVICTLIEEINSPSMACFSKAGYVPEKEIIYWTKRPSADS